MKSVETKKYKLTVFTATYNRGHLIAQLYHSLLRQSCFDFEWLVIDDGSQDHTPQLFEQWLAAEHPFPIRYYRQDNQGLIRALNRGVQLAQGEYFAKIDSDDYVVDDFADNFSKWLPGIADLKDVYAVAGLRITPNGTPLKGAWPTFIGKTPFVDATDLQRKEFGLDADMCEAWRTEVLRQHPFPVWPGEKFAPEQIVFHQIALEGYKIRWYPVAMSVCEYQEGGLTKGASRLERENPMGYAMMYNQRINCVSSFKDKCQAAMQCNALMLVGKNPAYILKSNCPAASLFMAVPGGFLAIRRAIQYRKPI